ncbi:MAG TPA: PP2C family protein-serine/threonine phosphatase [Bacteroidota bacterium]|nr:PP2C family protein-serine/threonine phosphatase [Bacteroidota bacterium]
MAKVRNKAVTFAKNGKHDVRRLISLIEASKLLNTTLDLDKLLRIILELTTKNMNADRGTIYLIDHAKKELWSRVVKGKELVEIRLPLGTGIAGHVAKTGKTINLEDAWKDKRFFSGFDIQSGYQTKTMLCMPMKNREGKVIGVFQILNKKKGVFDREDELFLKAFSDHVALAIENAWLHQEILEKELVEKEIGIAASIQQKLLPKELPNIPRYDLDATAVPCHTIGGDFYDIIPLPEGRYAFVVADVSGKGIPASLLVSTLHASLHAYIQTEMSLPELVKKLNVLVHRNTTPERYITFFISVLDPKNDTFTFVNAGHNFPFLAGPHRSSMEMLESGGMPLGMFDAVDYETRSVELKPGDLLVMYTDGVTEAMNKSLQEYGEERFRRCVEKALTMPASQVRESIISDVHSFTSGEAQSDDLTLMVLKRLSN